MLAKTFPLCFASAQDYVRWRSSFGAECGHCRDCLPQYQLCMNKTGRCEHPEVMFTVDGEQGVVGA